jgi:cation:H+ antiporter
MSAVLSPASPFLLVLAIFLVSLLIVLSAAAWFTRRLEALCDRLDLSAGMLSILSALGANIPNYVASIVAIANGQQDVGLGIIIGSNIYNLAIILGISTLAAPGSHGIHLRLKEKHDVLIITYYAFAITLTTLVAVWLLPRTSFAVPLYGQPLTLVPVILALILTIAIFGSLVLHIVRRPHPPHMESTVQQGESTSRTLSVSLKRLIAEVLFALVIALGGVIVMVQSGEQLTADMHMPAVLAGLLVLAVATSLPNTVVAVILVRTGRMAACVEEIFSSNSINAALGIALPLLLWRTLLQDHLLLLLDGPFILLLTLGMIVCIRMRHLNRIVGLLLLLSYVVWVGLHLLVSSHL